MDFHEAYAKRRMMDLLKLTQSQAPVTKIEKGDRTMPFDGKTAAESRIEEIAKAILAAGKAPTIAKARMDAWSDNQDLWAQDAAERRSPEFQAKVAAKHASERVAKSSQRSTSTAETQLDSLAKARAAKDGVSYAKAYTDVLDTEEGRALYAKHKQDVMAQE
ncbi:MAG: hypothetical protein EOS36_14890 [Mesorhizobium sp.]|nr:MAG: hypothetical protein EOS36_14890 [Mesorhizobium sp.]RWE39606.1 MAG: hypothetical protein EOS79_20495 [Mesorhizobium sp.]